MASELLRGFYLGDRLVEPLRGQVSSPDGTEQHLPPKAVEVLLCLAAEPGQLVTRESILKRVWGAGHGSNETLSHAISEVRHVFGDHHDDPTYIQTLPKRGYRLLIDPQPRSEHSGPHASIYPETATESHSVVDTSVHSPPSHSSAGTPSADPSTFPTMHSEISNTITEIPDMGLIENLKRRGVIETAIAYLVIGWLLIQVADIVFERLMFPGWTATFVTVLVIAGLPIALILSWFLEFRDGKAVVHEMTAADTRRRRFGRTYLSIVAALAIAAIAVYIYDRNIGLPDADKRSTAAARYELPPIVENSIAVLPFLNIDGSEETSVFANGLAEDVITRLARIPGLHVAARGDSHSLAPNSSSQQVRERLRVQSYLEGSVEMAGEQMSVTVQMIDAETGFHILGRTFRKSRDAFFVVRDEITSLTVANVRVALPPDVQAATLKVVDDPAIVDAYVLYRRGIDAARKPASIASITEALDWFIAALEVDPDYAAAHAGQCATYVKGYTEVDDSSFIEKAQSACGTALALNPNLDIVHTALGDLYFKTGQYAIAEKQYKNALSKDPSSVVAMTGLGRTYQRLNRADEAEAQLREAVAIHPGNANAFNKLGVFLFQTGRFAEAAEQYEFVVALEPDDMRGLSNLASAYMMQGRFDAAAKAFEEVIAHEPTIGAHSNLGLMKYYLGDFEGAIEQHSRAIEMQENDYLARVNLADALWAAKRRQQAQKQYELAARLAESALRVNPNDPLTLMDIAWIRTALGEHDRAKELIGRSRQLAPDDPYVHYIDGLMNNRLGDVDSTLAALEKAVALGYSTRLLAGDPNMQNLRNDTRFKRIVSVAK